MHYKIQASFVLKKIAIAQMTAFFLFLHRFGRNQRIGMERDFNGALPYKLQAVTRGGQNKNNDNKKPEKQGRSRTPVCKGEMMNNKCYV